MTKEGVWGHPPLPGWLHEQHHPMMFVDLEILKPELTKTLTGRIKVTHFFISQHVDRKSLLLKKCLFRHSESRVRYLIAEPTEVLIRLSDYLMTHSTSLNFLLFTYLF